MKLRFLQDLSVVTAGSPIPPQWSSSGPAPTTTWAWGAHHFKAGDVKIATRIDHQTISIPGVGRLTAEQGVDYEVIEP